MKKIVLCLVWMSVMVGCDNRRAQGLVFEKLEGTWKVENENEFERWTTGPDGGFTSVMYSLNNGDTVYAEKVKIFQNGSRWIFETLVKDQNRGKYVKFESTHISDEAVTFENPTHDFPKVIHYDLESPTVLKAYIAGNADTVFFNFNKVK